MSKGLAIFYADQCDPKKCSSIKIKLNKSKLSFPLYWVTSSKRIHRKSIVLTPFGKYLLPKDIEIYEKFGLTVLDCSWKQNHPILQYPFRNGRKLPKLLAGNPVNHGKWEFLTSMEATIAAFFIMGLENEAKEIVSCLPSWGESFMILNKELLFAYQQAETVEDYAKIFKEFL